MGTMTCPHPAPLLEGQDWYRLSRPLEKEVVRGYELKKLARHHHIKRSYASHKLEQRRRRIYGEALALLATSRRAAASSYVALENEIRREANRWKRETAHLSSPLQKMSHPSYQAIIGMSAASEENRREIIRFMLRDLRSNQGDWFLALSYLTHHNPIRGKDYGKPSKMAESWVKWGESQGLL